MWFGATYGSPENRGGGSNIVAWTHDGAILFPRRLPGAKVAWEFQAQRPDTTISTGITSRTWHGVARKSAGSTRATTRSRASRVPIRPSWDFRASESSDGKWIVFCRGGHGCRAGGLGDGRRWTPIRVR